MATLADVLRQTGYSQDGTLAAPATESPMTKALSEHIKTLPQQLATNQAALDNAIGSWNKTDFGTGLPNPNYRPEAIAELTQLMPNIGGLTAWHGTPHKIKGAFDISKVGTGEGAQAYGHGMYFAENPKVAEAYKTQQIPAANLNAANGKSFDSIEDFFNEVKPKGVGNLYKVDIPDEHIPNMLDWDKPLSEMTKKEAAIIEPLKQALISRNNPYDPKSFETIGQVIQSSRGTNPNLEKELLEAGITGIKYLDEGSRNQAVQPYYQLIRKSDNAVYTQMQDLKKAEEFVKNAKKQGIDFEISAPVDKRTSNFVVFDPSTVKILEENGKPLTRKELIKKQVKELKD